MKTFLVTAALLLTLPAAADSAQDIWSARCKSCHGEDGRGKTRLGLREHIPDFTAPRWQEHRSDDVIRNTIRNGSPESKAMKAYKDRLNAEEIESLVHYIRTLAAAGPQRPAP